MIIWSLAAVLVVGPLVWLGVRALIAKDSLESAEAQVKAVQTTLTSGKGSVASVYGNLHAKTANAVSMTSDLVWWLAEQVPVVGANFVAVRETAKVVDDVVVNGIGPIAAVPNLSINSLKPVDGKIDVEKIQELVPVVATANAGLVAAEKQAEKINSSGTIGQVRSAVLRIQDLLSKATVLSSAANRVLPLLPDALGVKGTRNYLLLFQNNAEERAGGGNPAALALVTLNEGKISLAAQANSFQFDEGIPVFDIGPEAEILYGPATVQLIQNVTLIPDFSISAQIARNLWFNKFGVAVDAVVAIDPVALGYLLAATGPVPLSTGDVLDSTNAVSFLLSGVYAKYVEPSDQDAAFASAAKSVFDAVSGGQGSVAGYLGAMVKMVADRRLLLWSSIPEEQEQIIESPLSGVLPVSNDKGTAVGVFFNDRSTAKMSYYLDGKIDLAGGECPAGYLSRASVSLYLNVDEAAAAALPVYVSGTSGPPPGYPTGTVTDDVIAYGPVGATAGQVTVGGQPVAPTMSQIHEGRPVSVYQVIIPPGGSTVVTFDFIGGTDPTEPLLLVHTPRVHETPTTVGPIKCD